MWGWNPQHLRLWTQIRTCLELLSKGARVWGRGRSGAARGEPGRGPCAWPRRLPSCSGRDGSLLLNKTRFLVLLKDFFVFVDYQQRILRWTRGWRGWEEGAECQACVRTCGSLLRKHSGRGTCSPSLLKTLPSSSQHRSPASYRLTEDPRPLSGVRVPG